MDRMRVDIDELRNCQAHDVATGDVARIGTSAKIGTSPRLGTSPRIGTSPRLGTLAPR